MPTLENDRLVFRFPQIEGDANFSIYFQRTLRIPDTETTYSLPPGLGSFPVRHAEDFSSNLPPETNSRGGVILPMWQAEAMWIGFSNRGPDWDFDFPVAIKVAAGKINAVTGKPWRPELHRRPQDYMVSPQQPWLDGFAVEKGVIRQFLAMPLGDGYSVEEQVTGEAEWGGLQISVTPLKAEIWKKKRAAWEKERERRPRVFGFAEQTVLHSRPRYLSSMAMGAGGRMRQEIYPDTFNVGDWDVEATDRTFVTLVHAKDWKTLTGEVAPNEPPAAREYSEAGLPWFEYFGKDQDALPGSATLAGVKSVAKMFKKLTGSAMPQSSDIVTKAPTAIGPGARKARVVRTEGSWDN